MSIDEYLKDYSVEDKKKFMDMLNESDRIRTEFMKQYDIEHQCCPECGEIPHGTTLVAYIFNLESPESYKDLNDCTCSVCGDRHVYHERIKKK